MKDTIIIVVYLYIKSEPFFIFRHLIIGGKQMQKEVLLAKVETYIDKVFFYCLKRCNNREDAEDLSQTILLETVVAINKGHYPENFDYYIWAIARNQYAKYQAQKIKARKNEEFVEKIEVNENINVLDEIITDEKITLINNQIKLLSREYVSILYGYYVEDKTLKRIAEEMNLPLGTVKRKLFELRNKLTEAVKMVKLNGKKAYIPKDYVFVKSCDKVGKYDPHDFVDSLINKNLLYHSYNNPCTLEDYALELGISMPYIEDIVKRLNDATLLKKYDENKYVTSFAFLSKEFRKETYDIVRKYAIDFNDHLIEFAKNNFSKYKQILDSKHEDHFLMWSLMFLLIKGCEEDAFGTIEYTKRPGDGRWDFVGLEYLNEGLDFYFVGCNGNSTLANFGFAFPFKKNNVSFDTCANGNEDFEIFAYIKNNPHLLHSKIDELDENIKKKIKSLLNQGYIRVENDMYYFNFVYLSKEQFHMMKNQIMFSDDLLPAIKILKSMHHEIKDSLTKYLPQYLNDQIPYLADTLCSNIRSKVIDGFVEAGLLGFIDDGKHFTYNLIVIER